MEVPFLTYQTFCITFLSCKSKNLRIDIRMCNTFQIFIRPGFSVQLQPGLKERAFLILKQYFSWRDYCQTYIFPTKSIYYLKLHNILEILKFKFLKFSHLTVSVCSNLPKYCRHSKTFDPRNEQLAP